jgi:hypothetical protein
VQSLMQTRIKVSTVEGSIVNGVGGLLDRVLEVVVV